MHIEILTPQQLELLPLVKRFKRSFYMVGGTAVALHIGHRRSVDFDLFTSSRLNKSRIKATLLQFPFDQKPVFEDYDQLHLVINQVKFTYFSYPYQVPHPLNLASHITIPTLLTLSAMKAFALGRRSKWKDYVDLYYILHDYYNIKEISLEASRIFNQQFSEKLFREQLAFHKDIDFSEPVEFIINPVSETEIKDFLIDKATEIL